MSRPVTLLSVLVLQGEGGSIANGITGGGGGIAEIRERGVGGFIFGKLTVVFLIFKNFVHLNPRAAVRLRLR